MRFRPVTGLYKGSDGSEVVHIQNIKGVSAQLEGKPLGDVNRLFQADVEITIARLPEVLNTWPLACIEYEAFLLPERKLQFSALLPAYETLSLRDFRALLL
jgi:hypothetical protein